MIQQAGTGLPTGGDRDPTLCRSQPAGSAGMRRYQARQRLGKGPPLAGRVAIAKTPHPERKPNRPGN
jgi:hypothetical protein